jgi:hypothetical protein
LGQLDVYNLVSGVDTLNVSAASRVPGISQAGVVFLQQTTQLTLTFTNLQWLSAYNLWLLPANTMMPDTPTYMQISTTKPYCGVALGMASGFIPDASFSASTTLSTAPVVCSRALPSYLTPYGSCAASTAWCSNAITANEYLQVDLGTVMMVSSIATGGSGALASWTKTFYISYSQDGEFFLTHAVNGVTVTFTANVDATSLVINTVIPLYARYFRINPLTYQGRPCLRVEFYGCNAQAALGVPGFLPGYPIINNQTINAFTLSVAMNVSAKVYGIVQEYGMQPPTSAQIAAAYTGLGIPLLAGRARTLLPYIATQVYTVRFTRLAFNTSYTLWLTVQDISAWQHGVYSFDFTTQSNTPCGMGYGISWAVAEPLKALGYMQAYDIEDTQMTSTGTYSSTQFQPQCARLNMVLNGASNSACYYAAWLSSQPFLQGQYWLLDLMGPTPIGAIATQSRGDDTTQWTTNYKVETSLDGIYWNVTSSGGNQQQWWGNLAGGVANTVYNLFPNVTARYLRLTPMGYVNFPSMRMEIYQCVPNTWTTGPSWRNGYPNITLTSDVAIQFQGSLVANDGVTGVAGVIYWTAVLGNTTQPPPNAYQIVAGTDSNNVALPVNLYGSITVTATGAGSAWYGLAYQLLPRTNYTIWLVRRDSIGQINYTPSSLNVIKVYQHPKQVSQQHVV